MCRVVGFASEGLSVSFPVKTLDSADLNGALAAVVETAGAGPPQLRVRPHTPASYYPAQRYSIILRWDALDALIALAERNGYRRPPR